jgi:hypothetical protein
MGYPWDIQPNGMVSDGKNDCFDGGLVLNVNGQQFNSAGGQMTKDGHEFILSRRTGNIEVTRRVLIDVKRGFARYLESFRNPGKTNVTVQVGLHTSLGNNCQMVATSDGANFAGGKLGKKHCGIAACNPGGSRPTVAFLLCDPRAKVQPTIVNQSNYNFQFGFSLVVPPGRTATIYHVIAQRSGMTAQQLPTFYKDVFRNRLIKPQIPRELAGTIVNFRVSKSSDASGPLLAPVLELADNYGIDRAVGDTLVLADEARLVGTITCDEISVDTQFGLAKVDIAKVAMLLGGAGISRPTLLFMRTGEVLAGEIEAPTLAIGTSDGLKIPLRPSRLDLLFFRADKQTDGIGPTEATALVQLRSFDCIAVKDGQSPLRAATAWGSIPFRFSDVSLVWSVQQPVPGHRILFSDGSRLSGFLAGQTIQPASLRWGTISISANQIRRVYRVGEATIKDPYEIFELDGAPEEWEVKAPFCLLTGNNAVAGRVELKTISILTDGGARDVPIDQVQAINRENDSELKGTLPVFVFTIQGAGQITGRFQQPIVPIRAGDRVWQVPTEQFLGARLKDPDPEAKAPAKPADPFAPVESPEKEVELKQPGSLLQRLFGN